MSGIYPTEKDLTTLRTHLGTIDAMHDQIERQRADRAENLCDVYNRAYSFFRTTFPHETSETTHEFANKILDMVGK